jgi:hypothetical protein
MAFPVNIMSETFKLSENMTSSSPKGLSPNGFPETVTLIRQNDR